MAPYNGAIIRTAALPFSIFACIFFCRVFWIKLGVSVCRHGSVDGVALLRQNGAIISGSMTRWPLQAFCMRITNRFWAERGCQIPTAPWEKKQRDERSMEVVQVNERSSFVLSSWLSWSSFANERFAMNSSASAIYKNPFRFGKINPGPQWYYLDLGS